MKIRQSFTAVTAALTLAGCAGPVHHVIEEEPRVVVPTVVLTPETTVIKGGPAPTFNTMPPASTAATAEPVIAPVRTPAYAPTALPAAPKAKFERKPKRTFSHNPIKTYSDPTRNNPKNP